MFLEKGDLIAVDYGHSCYPDGGAIGITKEEDGIKAIADKVISKLNRLGYKTIVVTPFGQRFQSLLGSLGYRTRLANEANAKFYLSIHQNKVDDPSANGIEVYCIPGGTSEILAKQVQSEMINYLKLRDRGVKYDNLYVTKYTNMPAILVECGFISNVKDVTAFNAEKYATAIVKGLTGKVLEDYKRYYVITKYLNTENYNLELNSFWYKYFANSNIDRWYLRNNSTGCWIETQYLSEKDAEKVAKKLNTDGLLYENKEE